MDHLSEMMEVVVDNSGIKLSGDAEELTAENEVVAEKEVAAEKEDQIKWIESETKVGPEDVADAEIPIDDSKKEEKDSLDKSRVKSIVDKTRVILLDDADGEESKRMVVVEELVSVHQTEVSVAVISVKKARKRLSPKQKNDI